MLQDSLFFDAACRAFDRLNALIDSDAESHKILSAPIGKLRERIFASLKSDESTRDNNILIAIDHITDEVREHPTVLSSYSSEFFRQLETIEGIVEAKKLLVRNGTNNGYEEIDESEMSVALKLIKDIDVRMRIYRDLKEECVEPDIVYIDQDTIIPTIARYIEARSPGQVDVEEIELGICHGLTVLYGYYQFMGKSDDFFARIEAVGDFVLNEDPAALERRSYRELTSEEREMERFCNDVIYFQDFMGQSHSLAKLKVVSEHPEIKKLSSQLYYASLYQPSDKKYKSLRDTLYRMCSVDEQEKYLLISTGDHAIGMFYRDCKVFLYDPRMPLPELPRDMADFDEVVDMMTTLLESDGEPIALGIELISKEEIKGKKELECYLFTTMNVGFGIQSYNSCSPLSIASQEGDVHAVQALLAGGADVSQADENGDLPFLIALQNGHSNVAKELFAAMQNFGIDVSDEVFSVIKNNSSEAAHEILDKTQDPYNGSIKELLDAINEKYHDAVVELVNAIVGTRRGAIEESFVEIENGYAHAVDELFVGEGETEGEFKIRLEELKQRYAGTVRASSIADEELAHKDDVSALPLKRKMAESTFLENKRDAGEGSAPA